ncbi:GPN-loop GTPase [Nematocida sp. AWRm80]|nr:GPN-loop GTPase [Nematocida sp. AWRm80]
MSTEQANKTPESIERENTVLIVLGLAGSGKTTFCHRLYTWLSEKHCQLNKVSGLNDLVCGVNLDPAAIATKMPLHYDIRDSISIKDIMEQKKLGPNGAILTALNLFTTQIDQFISQLTEIQPRYTIIDTPGQIEMFTTSVSGNILAKCIGGSKNTKVKLLYVIDGETAQNPQCFISNMLFSTSIQYRFQEELLIILNKADIEGSETIENMLSNIDTVTERLSENEYITPTLRSIALWTEEFYSQFKLHHVSSTNNIGKTDLLNTL